MKILSYCLIILSVFVLLSCDKDTEGLSGSVYFNLEGDNPAIVQVGEPYADAGCTVDLNGADVTSGMTTENTVDADAMGLYTVKYSVVNPDGIKLNAIRDVIVCNPSVTTDISGEWLTQEGSIINGSITFGTGYSVNIKYLAPGFFYIDDFLGGYYSQYRYPGYGTQLFTVGHFSLNEDNTLSLIDSHNNNWGDSLSALEDASYDPETGILTWTAVYGSSFKIILKRK